VRFQDAPLVQDDEENRNALFPYRDDPENGLLDQSHLDNQQIHAYHSRVLAEQDEQLDRLGESISRQRELSIQIGDELDEHVQSKPSSDYFPWIAMFLTFWSIASHTNRCRE
jgi:syntaxin 8